MFLFDLLSDLSKLIKTLSKTRMEEEDREKSFGRVLKGNVSFSPKKYYIDRKLVNMCKVEYK